MTEEADIFEGLLLKFEGSLTVPLADICADYLGMSPQKAGEMALHNSLPLPAHRLGSQKSPWMVALVDLSILIAQKTQEARADWQQAK